VSRGVITTVGLVSARCRGIRVRRGEDTTAHWDLGLTGVGGRREDRIVGVGVEFGIVGRVFGFIFEAVEFFEIGGEAEDGEGFGEGGGGGPG